MRKLKRAIKQKLFKDYMNSEEGIRSLEKEESHLKEVQKVIPRVPTEAERIEVVIKYLSSGLANTTLPADQAAAYPELKEVMDVLSATMKAELKKYL